MFAVIIPTLNAQKGLPDLLEQLRGVAVVVTDGGSADGTLNAAAKAKARIALGTPGRGTQLSRGVNWAHKVDGADWYFIVHADCRLPCGWRQEITEHIQAYPSKAGYFAFGAEARGIRPRIMEFVVGLRDIWPLFPYGDQGLLISREMYEAVGGYPQQALFEDVEIIRAIKRLHGRTGLRRMKGRLYSDVSAYAREGYMKRCLRNLNIIKAYNKGVSIDDLIARYTAPAK
ncbi:MAG: glycosyltransferase [Maricaulaceae bacterium]